jgi:hypothetical protein
LGWIIGGGMTAPGGSGAAIQHNVLRCGATVPLRPQQAHRPGILGTALAPVSSGNSFANDPELRNDFS